MTADLLREAAAVVRREWEPDQRDDPQAVRVHLAVADLLDRVADDYAIASYGYWATCADNIARAYLGRDS